MEASRFAQTTFRKLLQRIIICLLMQQNPKDATLCQNDIEFCSDTMLGLP